MKLFKPIKVPMRVRTRVITSAQEQQSQPHVIRLCRECAHYSELDDTCKVLNIINHINMDVARIKSLHCRTREDLCGMDARYYEPNIVVIEETPIALEKEEMHADFSVTYYIDGSVGVNYNEESVDNYYNTLHRDFNDVY